MMQFDLTVNVMVDDNATVAELTDMYTGQVLATGSAKRMPGDVRNVDTGINLATARALKNYAEFVLEHAACGAHFS